MMTRAAQRKLCAVYGAVIRPAVDREWGFNGTTLSILQALITSNKLRGKDDDGERPFRVGLEKLARRTRRDRKTIIRHIQILVAEKLVTVTKGVNGTSNTYSIHLSPMSDWMTSDEADALRRKSRTAAKERWRHKDKVTKSDLENVVMRGGCVTGAVKDETNRERRLRLTRIMHITQV
jgi:hypothetical protein